MAYIGEEDLCVGCLDSARDTLETRLIKTAHRLKLHFGRLCPAFKAFDRIYEPIFSDNSPIGLQKAKG